MFYRLVMVGLLLWLPACQMMGAGNDDYRAFLTESAASATGDNGQERKVGYAFTLAWEYRALSDYDRGRRAYYIAKVRKAEVGEFVPIPYVEDFSIPAFAKEELKEARKTLLLGLRTAHTPQNERLLAMAQTRFDCWLNDRERRPEESAAIYCREKFYESLAGLSVPETALTLYHVYFGSGRASISTEEMNKIRDVAGKFKNRPMWELVLSGFTDPVGDPEQNKTLSMRRTLAVKNALGQHGVPLDRILIRANGEAGKNGGNDAGVSVQPDNRQRRVDITFSPRGLIKSGIEEMMEEHGWGNLDDEKGLQAF